MSTNIDIYRYWYRQTWLHGDMVGENMHSEGGESPNTNTLMQRVQTLKPYMSVALPAVGGVWRIGSHLQAS